MRYLLVFLITAVLVLSGIPLSAQDGYFPIGACIVYNSDNPVNWNQELSKMQALGVNEIGDWTFPNDTMWLKNVCLPSNGAIKLFTYDGPHYVGLNRYDSTLCWGFIRPTPNGPNWADSLPADPVWQSIVKAHLDDVISNYIQRPEWAGQYGGLYIMNELKWGEPPWNEQQWDNVYTVVDWACDYWRNNANVPDELKNKTIYVMASQYLKPEHGSTLKTFSERLGNLGILENDRYPFYPYVPATYITNGDSFIMFQQHLQLWIGDGDSCLKYFEKDGTSRKWYALIQAFKAQICTTGTDTTTYKGWKDTWRWPTREEIRAQTWLALSRGAKGVKYFSYRSAPEDLIPSQCIAGTEKYRGMIDENRVPRGKAFVTDPYNQTLYDLYPDYRIYDWVKEIIDTVKVVGPILSNLHCTSAFSFQHGNGGSRTIPFDSCYISNIQSGDTSYHRYDFFELGTFKDAGNNDYFMVVNRYCLPKDTVTVNVTLTYPAAAGRPSAYFIVDALNHNTITGSLTVGQSQTFALRLLPGGGRLLRIMPFASSPSINHGAVYTNFKFVGLRPNDTTSYARDSIQVIQKYWSYGTHQDTLSEYGFWAADTGGWSPYADSSIQHLENSRNNRPNIFEVQYKVDGGGYITPTYTAQVYFNDVAPASGCITINNGAVFTNNRTASVHITGADAFPGLDKMRFAENPFGSPSGYVNLISNGTFGDTTCWTMNNATIYSGLCTVNGTRTRSTQWGGAITEPISSSQAASWNNKLLRLSCNARNFNAYDPRYYIYAMYGDSLQPASESVVYKEPFGYSLFSFDKLSDNLVDTFTLHWNQQRPLDHLELTFDIPSQSLPFHQSSYTGSVNLDIDNIRVEPVVNQGDSICDGWQPEDSTLTCQLTAGNGAKKINLQHKDLAGNVSTGPGWSDTITLDQTLPYADITIPVTGSYVNGTLNIYAYASDANFQSWTLDLKATVGSDWTTLNTGASQRMPPPKAMVVYTWNTATVPDGQYYLRLTSADLAANAKADTHVVCVNNGDDMPRDAVTADFISYGGQPGGSAGSASGDLLVMGDTLDNTVRAYSAAGAVVAVYGGDSATFADPSGAAVDDSSCIWVADRGTTGSASWPPTGR